MANIYSLDVSAANNTATGGMNWAENQAPSTVNNSARQMAALIAQFLGDIGGAIEAGGTANALTLTANSDFTEYADGIIVAFQAAADNTAAATLSVNGIGAKAIRYMTTEGDAALSAGMVTDAGVYVAIYGEHLNSAAGGWMLINPTADFADFVTLTGTQTLTNKTIDIVDTSLSILGSSDATKKLQFQVDGFTTATTRTITVPDASDTMVTLAATQTLTNKTLTGAALNGTLGATTPAAVSGTTGTFSGVLTGTTGSFSGTIVSNGNTLIGATGVPTATAALSAGAVGTYGMFQRSTAGALDPGDTISGSSLRYSSAGGDSSGTSPSGTWRCMGYSTGAAFSASSTTLFLRTA